MYLRYPPRRLDIPAQNLQKIMRKYEMSRVALVATIAAIIGAQANAQTAGLALNYNITVGRDGVSGPHPILGSGRENVSRMVAFVNPDGTPFSVSDGFCFVSGYDQPHPRSTFSVIPRVGDRQWVATHTGGVVAAGGGGTTVLVICVRHQ